MKTQPAKKQRLPTQEATLKEVLNEWIQALNQLSYWHRELTEAIQQVETTYQPVVTAAFQPNRQWAKAELIALRLDLCARLSSLLNTTQSGPINQTASDQTCQLRQDTQRITNWSRQIQTALGLDSVASA